MNKKEIGRKFDDGKLRYHLILPLWLKALVSILTFGAKKYDEYDWMHVDNAKDRYYSAMMRHIEAWRSGEWLDKESGLPHLWHAFTNLAFLIYFDNKKDKK